MIYLILKFIENLRKSFSKIRFFCESYFFSLTHRLGIFLMSHEPDRQWIEWDNAKYDASRFRGNGSKRGGSGKNGGGLGIWGWVIVILVIIYLTSR